MRDNLTGRVSLREALVCILEIKAIFDGYFPERVAIPMSPFLYGSPAITPCISPLVGFFCPTYHRSLKDIS